MGMFILLLMLKEQCFPSQRCGMTLACKASIIISPWWSRPAFKGWLRVLNRKWLGWSGKDRNAFRWSVQANPFWGVCAWRAHRGQPISRLATFWLTHMKRSHLSH